MRHLAYAIGADVAVDLVPVEDLNANRTHLAGNACECKPVRQECPLTNGVGVVFLHNAYATTAVAALRK